MGMSVWILFTVPYLAPSVALPEPETPNHTPEYVIATNDDIFGGDLILSEAMMRDAAGGTEVAVDITDLGVNIADNRGLVRDVEINDTVNGQIANNVAQNNSGITTIFNNTGNGVVFQSNVQVNIFLDGAQ